MEGPGTTTEQRGAAGAAELVRLARDIPGSFHPRAMPALSRHSYSRELWTTFFFSTALAITEGSIAGVFVKQLFTGVTPEAQLNMMVAVVGAAPEMANLVSFVWVTWSLGRPKVAFINTLQWVVIALIACVALVPRTSGGLWALAALAIGARVCWSGIITLRPTVWRQNYPRKDRARMVGKFSTVQVVTVAAVGLIIGRLMDISPRAYHFFIPVTCAIGLAAVVLYRRVRVRGERAMLRHEVEEASRQASAPGLRAHRWFMGPAEVVRVLRRDRFFAEFQLWLSVLGIGNLMLNPVLWIVLKERFDQGYAGSALVATTIPLLVMPVAIPLWARFLDRAHVVQFRSIHSWAFVVSTAVQLAGLVFQQMWLLYVGGAILGVAYAGGTLAWNMGHHDFAPPTQTSQYMAAHLTLNGIRGTLGPLASVALYGLLKSRGLDAGSIVLGLCLVFCVIGALGFVGLRVRMAAMVKAHRRA
jgi:MFS family permease